VLAAATALGDWTENHGILCFVNTGGGQILDMFRTTINVYGDTCAAVIIGKSEGETLKV